MKPSIHYIDNIESTNTTLSEWLQEGKIQTETYVLVSFRQLAGRGQRGNQWESEPDKNIAMSLLLQPKQFPAANFFLLSQLVSLSICRFLRKYLDCISIKWPNDIYYDSQKIAGILIENQLQGNLLQRSIIGIGLNVNQEVFLSDAPNPVSMKQLTHREFDLKQLCEEMSLAILEDYKQYVKEPNNESIQQMYQQWLYRKEGYHPYRDSQGCFMAKIYDIDPHGKLLLENKADGVIRRYDFKEVSFLPE